ncbi:MAG: AMP-binding protein, partial [Actinomycetota bacterium]
MGGPLEGLKQVAGFAHPRVARRLHDAGALDPKALLGLLAGLPWLIGRGPSLGIMSHMHAVGLGNKIALHDRHGSLTWSELDGRANRVAHTLQALGLGPNDRVAMLLRNGREIVEVILGAQKTGIVSCPLNTWAKPRELESTLGAARPKLLVYDTAHAEQVAECTPEDLSLLFVGDEAGALEGSEAYEDLLAERPASPPTPFTRRAGSPKVIIHTSGTTGTPKGASRNASAAGVGSLANLLSVVPYRRDDIILCPAPLFHSFGLATFTFGCVLGATFVLPEKFDPEESLRLIEEHRATAASFIPVMIKRIVTLEEEVRSRHDLSALRIVLASGSAMGPELRRAAIQTFGDALYDLYGSTEAGWVAIATPQDMASSIKTVGRPVPGIDAAIFSAEGE